MSIGLHLLFAFNHKQFKTWIFRDLWPLSPAPKLRRRRFGATQTFAICFIKVLRPLWNLSRGPEVSESRLRTSLWKADASRLRCAEERRPDARSRVFCWRRARALKSIFHFITSPPWLPSDHVRLPRQVEYLLDTRREGVADVTFSVRSTRIVS